MREKYPAEMVEKVARAICKSMTGDPDDTDSRMLPGTYQTDDGEPHWQAYTEHAIAALDAINYAQMREALETLLAACLCNTIQRADELQRGRDLARAALAAGTKGKSE